MPNKTKSNSNKSKSNKPRNQKKSQPRRANPRADLAITSAHTKRLAHEVCGLTDPFCSHAYGAKYPDDSATRTLPWTAHKINTLTSGPTGEITGIFLPNYNYFSLHHCATTAGIATPGALFPDATSPTDIQQFRIVSAGLRIKAVCAPLYASGMVHIRIGDLQKAASYGPTFMPALFGGAESLDIPLQDCKDVTIMCPRTAQPRGNFYLPGVITPGSVATDWTAPGFAPVTVSVSGGPTDVAVLSIEYVIHYELQFDFGINTAMLATSPPAYNPVVTSVANQLSSTTQSIFATGLKSLAGYVERRAVGAIAGALGGPPGLGAALLLTG